MGSGGIGSTGHVSGELFNMLAGIKMAHVPYRGEAPALTDLLGGQVQVVFSHRGLDDSSTSRPARCGRSPSAVPGGSMSCRACRRSRIFCRITN